MVRALSTIMLFAVLYLKLKFHAVNVNKLQMPTLISCRRSADILNSYIDYLFDISLSLSILYV